MASEILVPEPGIEPVPPALAGGFLTSDYEGSPSHAFYAHHAMFFRSVMLITLLHKLLFHCKFFSFILANSYSFLRA